SKTPYSAHSSQAPPSGACFFVHASRASTAPRSGLRGASQCSYFPTPPAGFIVHPRSPTMAIVRYQALRCAACLALLALAACAREGEDKMRWAQAALERNERLEVVAADPHSGTFTVRVKDTGELRMVHADQLIARPALPPPAPAVSPPGRARGVAGTRPGTAAPAATAPVTADNGPVARAGEAASPQD